MEFDGNQYSGTAFCGESVTYQSRWVLSGDLQRSTHPGLTQARPGTNGYEGTDGGGALTGQYTIHHTDHRVTCAQHYPSNCSCPSEWSSYGYHSEIPHLRTNTARTFTPHVVHCRSTPEPNHADPHHAPVPRLGLPESDAHTHEPNSLPNGYQDCSQRSSPSSLGDGSLQITRYAPIEPYAVPAPDCRRHSLSTKSYAQLGATPYSAQSFDHYVTRSNHISSDSRKPISHSSPSQLENASKPCNEYDNIDGNSPGVTWERLGWNKPQYCTLDEKSPSARRLQFGASKKHSKSGHNMCYLCGKSYARPSTLKTHLRTHSGERPYQCTMCSKTFSQTANLTAHMRTHSGEKPYRCNICQREFSQSSSVTTHMRTHSGERPYQCGFCSKSFSDSSTLTKHLRTHSGERPYQCSVCQLKFSQSGNLTRHMKVHEKDD